MADSKDEEGSYVLWAVFGVAIVTLVFAGFMYSEAIDAHRELYGTDYVEKNRFWGGTYQEVKFVSPWDLDISALLWQVLGKSLIFVVAYTLLARITLEVANLLGFALSAVLGREADYYQIGGPDVYLFAIVWPIFLIWIAYEILAIVFVSIFRIFW